MEAWLHVATTQNLKSYLKKKIMLVLKDEGFSLLCCIFQSISLCIGEGDFLLLTLCYILYRKVSLYHLFHDGISYKLKKDWRGLTTGTLTKKR